MRMGEYLPGELQDRLRELRDARGIKSQDKLADLVGVTRSTYGRVENGQTKTISSDMLIKLAKFYNVPTDYILGLSDTPENTGYDIKELGLSVEAAKNLYTKRADPNVVSLLLANDKFAGVTKLIATYFSGTMASMMVLQNNVLDFSYGIIEGHIKDGELPNDSLIRETKRNLKAAKLPGSQIELDRIQRQFMAAVKEIKEQAFSEVPLFRQMPETLRFEIMDKIRSEIMSVPKPNELPEAERIALTKRAILEGFSLDPTVDEEQMEMFGTALDHIIPVMFKKWDRKKK
jgi:transcriptional regulator with XRE-family HTH domain